MNDSRMNEPEKNDPELSDSLRRIVPDDLSPAGLVAGARGKRRRRNGVVGAVAALVLVAVAVPLALNLPSNDNLIAEPAATSTAPQTEEPTKAFALPGAQACYNDDGIPINHSQDASGPAEPGAVKAWLCGDYSPDTGAGSVGPHEPLTSGIDELLEGVQSEPEVDLAVISCPAEYNLSFNVVLEYADGTRSIVGGDRHGCRLTYDGGVAREGGDKFYGEAVTAWETQRESETDGWVVPHICPGPLSLIEMDAGDAVQASVCGEKEDGSWAATYLDNDLLEALSQELRAPLEENPLPDSSAPEQRVWLTTSNKFTDYQSFVRLEDGMYRAYDGEGLEWFWKPSADLSSRLDEALVNADSSDVPPTGISLDSTVSHGPGTPVDPGTPSDLPRPWVSEGCQAAANGELVSSVLPDGEVPDGADRIWLCTNGQTLVGAPAPPMEPLEDAGLVSEAVASFNELLPMLADQACTMELGPSYFIVHEYADGTRYAVEIQDYGCRAATAGDLVKENSELYKETLLDLWSKQRTNEPKTQTRPGPLCPLTSSLFGTNLQEARFTSGAACVGWGDIVDIDRRAGEEVPISERLLSQITAQLPDAPLATVDGEGPVGPTVLGPDGDSIVLLTADGDPFVLFHQEDGAFYWPVGEYARVWTPTGETANEFKALFEE